MVKTIKKFLLICLVGFIISCAQVVAPTGGETDRIPPSILAIDPENQSLNFSSNTFTLEFDEYVVLKNMKEQLIVSPPLKYSLQYKIKGKKLIFTIKDTLKVNTTYVFNFGNAIVDLNEGNPLRYFQYVFSTGSVIDSLNLSGRVVDAFELTPEKEVVLLLYPSNASDSAFTLELPSYISRANDDGSFTFTNLASDSYNLFALEDKNDNYLYDRPDEKIGFVSEPVNPSDSAEKIQLYAFSLPDTNQFIEKQKAVQNALKIDFKLDANNTQFELVDTLIEGFIQKVEFDQNKATLWHKATEAERLKLSIKQGSFMDTIKFTPKTMGDSAVLKLVNNLDGKLNFFEPIELIFNRPLKSIVPDSISVLDGDSNLVPFTITLYSIDVRKALLAIENPAEANFLLTIQPNAFEDIYQRTNDTIRNGLFFSAAEDFGNLIVKIQELKAENLILQLTDSKGKILTEYFESDSVYTFKHLPAAQYGLRLIADKNVNRKWDAGNYYEGVLPERVIIYDEVIDIRQNWEKEIIWIINQ